MPIISGDGNTGGVEVTNVKLGDYTTGGVQVTEVVLGNGITGGLPVWPATGPVPPQATVDQQPTGGSFFVLETVNLTCSFDYTGTLTYRWEISTDGGSNWSTIEGETTTSYSFTAALEDDSNQYRCVATDEYLRVTTTNAAAITVENAPSGSQTFTSSGTFVVPAGVTSITVSAVGGGGGGGGGSGTSNEGIPGNYRIVCTGGGGGAAGTMYENVVASVTPGQNIAITIGAGGAGGAASFLTAASPGATGGNTVVAGIVTANGGPGGGGGSGQESTGADDGWRWVYGSAGGSSQSASGTRTGRNGGGQSGSRASANESQSINGAGETGNGVIPVIRTSGGVNKDAGAPNTSTGGGAGGSSKWGAGGIGATPSRATVSSPVNGVAGGNGGVGAGGGGGTASAYNYPAFTGKKGGDGGRGEVRISW